MFQRKISRMKEKELEIMVKMASAQLQAVYFGHASGYKHKFTYFISTIKQMDKYLQPTDGLLQSKLMPTITRRYVCSEGELKLLSLPCR